MSSQPMSTKMKKRKTVLDDDDYIEADLKWFKDKQLDQSVPLVHGHSPGQAEPTPVEPPDPCVGGSSAASALEDELLAQERPRSRSPSIPLHQVVQAKPRPSMLSAAKADAPLAHAPRKAFVKQKRRGKGPPGFKKPPISVGQSPHNGESMRSHDRESGSSKKEGVSQHAHPASTSTSTAQFPGQNPSASPFAHNCNRVLSLARGRPSHAHAQQLLTLAFELTAEEVAQIERWRSRYTTIEDLSTSMCVSLVSYTSSQCTAMFVDEGGKASVDIVKCGHPVKWPADSSLFAMLESAGNRGSPQSIALSPPFNECEPDGSIDLGAHGLHPGSHTLQIHQYRDYSDRAFAIVLHHPTAAQLADLKRLRDQDRSWREMLDRLGTFSLPVPPLKTPTLPKMNAMYDI
ncbi:hypothetical protein C8T65DRAFT_739392 [Cerioporus squamosus]|nr:hypothetical protein C8T65DRAFT_739392 [Cerioporus squamosus]